jgi:hypothetical protein
MFLSVVIKVDMEYVVMKVYNKSFQNSYNLTIFAFHASVNSLFCGVR